MAACAFQVETPPPPLPLGDGVVAAAPSKKVYEGVHCYPVELEEAIDKIYRCMPGLFTVLAAQFSGGIAIEVEVALPIINKEFVAASSLAGKDIEVGGMQPNADGNFDLLELWEKGIHVTSSPPRFKAHWDFEKKTIALAHSHYSRFPPETRVHEQIQSLVFELSNTYFTSQFQDLFRRVTMVSKEEYAQAFEEIEFSSTRLTSLRLAKMEEQGEFNEAHNSFSTMYPDFDLYYLHQQALNHSYQYGLLYDTGCGESSSPYRGTWPNSFPAPDMEGKLSVQQTILGQILGIHLHALYHPDPTTREEKEDGLRGLVEKVSVGAMQGHTVHKHVWGNLQYFQEKYAAYVERVEPERVVHLESKVSS